MTKEARQEFIKKRLAAMGKINRKDLMDEFGISKQQATTDFSVFNAVNPDAWVYDYEAKCYKKVVL